ncbi:MAG: hypothetical protein H0W64_01875 [Gammaproteobacteria bacterium]|nr:hypothetical protein [Gammaproteobacteria bacterium]
MFSRPWLSKLYGLFAPQDNNLNDYFYSSGSVEKQRYHSTINEEDKLIDLIQEKSGMNPNASIFAVTHTVNKTLTFYFEMGRGNPEFATEMEQFLHHIKPNLKQTWTTKQNRFHPEIENPVLLINLGDMKDLIKRLNATSVLQPHAKETNTVSKNRP